MFQTNARVAGSVLTPCHRGAKADSHAQLFELEARRARRPHYRGPRSWDRLLDSGQEPPAGTHIVTPRRGYTHHGIYVGHGKVVQYAGLTRGLRRRPVEEVALTQFTQGCPIWVRPEESRRFDSDEVVRRARSRVGEDRYHVFTNNCEHF